MMEKISEVDFTFNGVEEVMKFYLLSHYYDYHKSKVTVMS